jgi:hypothetical protein
MPIGLFRDARLQCSNRWRSGARLAGPRCRGEHRRVVCRKIERQPSARRSGRSYESTRWSGQARRRGPIFRSPAQRGLSKRFQEGRRDRWRGLSTPVRRYAAMTSRVGVVADVAVVCSGVCGVSGCSGVGAVLLCGWDAAGSLDVLERGGGVCGAALLGVIAGAGDCCGALSTSLAANATSPFGSDVFGFGLSRTSTSAGSGELLGLPA